MRLLLLAALAAPALAAPHAPKVRASFISSLAAAAPGESFDVGLRLVHEPHWHTYWRNAGDSGTPTELEWRLPRGWSAGPLEWPAPERITAGGLTSFGYSGEVTLPVRLEVPADARPGTRARLRARAEWLECAEICVPGKAELLLELPVEASPRPSAAGANRLQEARSRLPRRGAGVRSARLEERRLVLELEGRHPGAEFFAYGEGLAAARGSVSVSPASTELSLALEAGAAAPESLKGIVLRPGRPPLEVDERVSRGGALARALLLAFLGGLLLNLMPCVFPVLSLKALSLVGRAGGSAAGARKHAAAFTLGVVLSFEALAGGILAARAAGASLGWGFQLQNPFVVAALAALFVGLGLNLLGFFELGGRLMGLGAKASSGEGYGGSFLSGVFAVVVAAPCTAPFMGAALGWALLRPAPEALAAFAALGLGTAAPYALLASWPALLKRLPRPGPWMETLKKLLALPMLATAAWLLWVLARLLAPAPGLDAALWKPWSAAAVAESRAAGKTVFVDFTAAWCLSCQVNERVVLSRSEVHAALSKPSVAAYQADWTSRDPVIAAELRAHGRAGVPLYIVYPPGGAAVVLPEILTPSLVLDALGEKP